MICYKKRTVYKYNLEEDYTIETKIFPEKSIDIRKLKLSKNGVLLICKGYAWDGASGPIIDTRKNMRGSLVHDALYQLLREEKIDPSYKATADLLLKDVLIDSGTNCFIAWVVYMGVSWFGAKYATPDKKFAP